MIAKFEDETGWRPRVVQPVAGALAYRQYSPLIRCMMKRIARKVIGQTDISRNYEFTNWDMLDRFVDDWAVARREEAKIVRIVSNQLNSWPDRWFPNCDQRFHCRIPLPQR